MSSAWAAIIGAIVGGTFTLVGALAVELRRDRRRQIGAARLILSELDRSTIAIDVLTERTDDESWLEGPHPGIRTMAWTAYAADFIGRLTPSQFEQVDRAEAHLASAGEWGLTTREASRLKDEIATARSVLVAFTEPTWFDLYVWHL